VKKALRKRIGARKRLGLAPTTASRHQPRTAHNAASPRPDTRPPPHPRPPPRAPPQTPIATTIHPRDPAETTQRPPTTAAGGGQAGRHAGWPAGGQIGRGWRRTAVGGRRSAVGDRHAGTQTRRRPVRQSQQIARGVERHRRRAAGNRRHGGRRQAACGSGSGLAMVSGAARPPTPVNHPPRHLLHTFPHLSPAKQASGRAETARKRMHNRRWRRGRRGGRRRGGRGCGGGGGSSSSSRRGPVRGPQLVGRGAALRLLRPPRAAPLPFLRHHNETNRRRSGGGAGAGRGCAARSSWRTLPTPGAGGGRRSPAASNGPRT
jgi:hypothetical protein